MSAYESPFNLLAALLDRDTRDALSLPIAALITGAVLQAESTIELANRVYDRYMTA